MNNGTFTTGTYYLVANHLYPYNPSLEDELNRLLDWNTGNYVFRRNDFVQNGTDSEHCPDENTSSAAISVAPGTRVQTSSPNHSFFSTPPPLPQPQPSPQPRVQRQFQDRGIPSAIFPSANRRSMRKKLHCSFCKNNGERELVYASHNLKTDEGIIICPILRNYTCPICHINGDQAHTLKYCPLRAGN